MQLQYSDKKNVAQILRRESEVRLKSANKNQTAKNFLIEGDNLLALKALRGIPNISNKVDLIYIDPPFSTNTIFRVGKSRTSTISPSSQDEIAYKDVLKGADFIEFLRERVILMRELMSNQGSFYLHIDYKIGHYVKVMLDEIFGQKNFRNDITRIKCNPKNFSRRSFGNQKDLILFYTKTDEYIWNEPKRVLEEEGLNKRFNKADSKGRKYTTTPLHAPGETKSGETNKSWRGMKPPVGRHWRYAPKKLEALHKAGLIEWSSTGNPRKILYKDEHLNGKVQDVWFFKDPAYPVYPTEKNIELLKFIVETSSNHDSLIMDAFAGSGTSLVAANNLGRSWVGIDQSREAIKAIYERLSEQKFRHLVVKN